MAQTSRLVVEIDSRDAEQKAADVRKALGALEDAGLKIKPAMDKAGAGLDGLSSSSDKAKKSVHEQRDEIDALLGSINPLTRRLNELEKQELALAKAHKSGKIETDTYKEYQAEITKTRTALTGVGLDMGKAGMSAKQMSANLRGVPAQFTDIFTSVAGGQPITMVALQQGGQLKDMFGGIGPAAKALGGYVAGLITPFTIAAGAFAALGFAAYKGYEQAEQYRKALTLTGQAAGKTSDDLIGLSVALAGGRNFAEASSAVLALAGSGRVTGEVFTEVARAATELAVATGKSAADIADQLSSTKGSVTDLAAEYSDKYGAITLATFEQIRALEQQGDRMGAVKLLSTALADEMNARNKEMQESTRGLAKAWDSVKSSISSTWAELKAGLSASPEMFKLQHLQSQLQEAQKIGDKALINGLTEQVSLAQSIVDAQTQKTELVSAEIQERKQSIADEKKWSEDGQKYRSNQVKMEKEIADARRLGLSAKASEAEIEDRIGKIRADYAKKDPKVAAPKAYVEDAGMKTLDQARQQFAVLQQQNALIGVQNGEVDKLGASGQALVKWEQQLADIKSKQTLTADQKSLVANQELITAQLKRNAGLERENELRKTATEEVAKLSAFQANQSSRLSTAQDGLNSSIEGIGLGSKARDRLKQDLAIQKDYSRQSADLLEQRNSGRITPDLYDKENTIVQEGLAKRLVMQQDYYGQQDAAQNDWLAGASSAWQNYFDIATDYNQQTQDATANLLGDTTSSLSSQIQGLVDGTVEVGDAFRNLGSTMAGSVLGALSDIAAQWVVTQALKMAGITAETTAVVASEGIKTTAKVTGDAVSVGSTLASLAATTAASVTAAATTMASWLPTALVASIGTFGAAAVVGGAGLLAAFALIKGFSDGGYTGAGGVNEPAGMVHKGEVVWSQADIRRSGGVSAVEAMRKGNVSAGPTTSSGRSASASNGVTAQERPLVVNLHEDASRAGQVNRSQLSEQDIVDIYVSNISSEGQIHEANQSKYGLKSQGA